VLSLIAEGEANRHIGATKMNEGSSRSHTVFRMVWVCGDIEEQKRMLFAHASLPICACTF
jgi:hypothetical protein